MSSASLRRSRSSAAGFGRAVVEVFRFPAAAVRARAPAGFRPVDAGFAALRVERRAGEARRVPLAVLRDFFGEAARRVAAGRRDFALARPARFALEPAFRFAIKGSFQPVFRRPGNLDSLPIKPLHSIAYRDISGRSIMPADAEIRAPPSLIADS